MIAKFKFGYVDGSTQDPSDALKKKNWVKVNSMLVSWIILLMMACFLKLMILRSRVTCGYISNRDIVC